MLGACDGVEDLLGSLEGSEETEGDAHAQREQTTCLDQGMALLTRFEYHLAEVKRAE